MHRIILASFIALLMTFHAAPLRADGPLRILVMGDSMMASHRVSRRAVSHAIARALRAKVTDQSVMGARIIYRLPITGSLGLNIGRQYREGDWDWIVLNGGGNDLWLGCGCSRCHRRMNQLISEKGNAGEIAKLIVKLRRTGAKVAYVGYLRSPGAGSPIEHCRDDGDELERRLKRLAALVDGFYYVSIADMVPHGDLSFHAVDMIHPSLKGSRAIGQRVAATIKAVEAGR
nr:SGNH/GDSL hydrolase family protein [uncultured Roseovarius sp.]